MSFSSVLCVASWHRRSQFSLTSIYRNIWVWFFRTFIIFLLLKIVISASHFAAHFPLSGSKLITAESHFFHKEILPEILHFFSKIYQKTKTIFCGFFIKKFNFLSLFTFKISSFWNGGDDALWLVEFMLQWRTEPMTGNGPTYAQKLIFWLFSIFFWKMLKKIPFMN